jgi:ribonuclease HI
MGQDMSTKYYAVAKGRKVGIFTTWSDVEPLVKGYSGAKYKSFKKFQDAQDYLADVLPENKKIPNPLYETDLESQTDLFGNTSSLTIYTDGSCVDQIGGFGCVIVVSDTIIPISGKVPSYPTTNQVAELYAIYSAISYSLSRYKNLVLDKEIVIYTDSKYSIGCLTQWHYNWNRNGWINSKGQPVSNKNLIQNILQISTGLDIKYNHVKAHNGDKYNEWADTLANNGRQINL